jgi:manganese/zinc/iron transport system permease protein
MNYQLETVLVLAAVAAACAVPGVFLLLRRMALAADAISHVLLFGIVVAYFAVGDLSSPWLFLGAAASGVMTVAAVELLQRSRLIKSDAAIGLVFPAMLALGTLFASMYLRNTHLDVDRVLLGSAELSTLDRFTLFGADLAPRSLVVMSGMFLANLLLLVVFYKELKLSTFDASLAATLGFAPALLHYGLMTMVSFTCVAAFDAVGPVVVVALLVVPAASAYLLTDRLSVMMLLSILLGVVGASLGAIVALVFDTNIAGTVATMQGLIFGLVYLVAPKRGLIAFAMKRWHQRRRFHETTLTIHLFQHEGTPTEADESRYDGLHRHLHWLPGDVSAVVKRSERHGLVEQREELLKLTNAGRERAKQVLG